MREERPRFGGETPTGLMHVDMEPTEEDEELAGYIERVEKAAEDHKQQVPLDDQGQAMVQHIGDDLPDDAVVLPITQTEFEQGMESGLLSSARWLAEWCLFLIKKYGEKVFFRG